MGAVENEEFGSPLLHPLLAGRWSPASFDPSHDVAPDEILVLLEAARWAPFIRSPGAPPVTAARTASDPGARAEPIRG